MVKQFIEIKYNELAVGAASYDTDTQQSAFEYEKSFINSGLELSPLMMPLAKKIYTFPNIDPATFKGLSGLLADSLPDDFGNSILNAWVARSGRSPSSITPLERLQYTGERGMGALTYSPPTKTSEFSKSKEIEISSLVSVAQDILNERQDFGVDLNPNGHEDKEAMKALMSVGMSAGGARPKAVLAFNNDFTQVRSGQAEVPDGFSHYLMKFDGVSEHNKNEETFGDPLGYGAMEYCYYLLANEMCGIDMMPTTLLNEGNRRHFVTQRFDRIGNKRIHVQTLNAMAHVSYKRAGEYSYEELFGIARQLKLKATDAEQLFKRMVFNIIARNHDDHSKNFGFMMDNHGKWSLSPAYDIAYSYKPDSKWVAQHWMSLNGKRDNFTREDFHGLRSLSPIFTKQMIDNTIDETIEHVSQWKKIALEQDVPRTLIGEIEKNLRLKL
ncbi:type II toxin-antitoxin system HipA family toxin [Photobacterium kishitanii]|uniref:Toxin HipA n=1 Tax=Photobacterium kishitanii TaxID=318456 RepID=A0A2T3KM72_9GAMM|nr:type II toxin-antitoxin system HipA family toxin [Photobacterium kishitanii]PSV00740.1 toxin HipA [Photobacterium kishitanii]